MTLPAKRIVSTAAVLALFMGALWLLHHELRHYNYRDVKAALLNTSYYRVSIAISLTAGSYFVLTLYDVLALRYIGRALSYPRVAIASFVGYVFSHSITFLGGMAARYRIYSASGISAIETARIVAFCGLTYWVGFFTVGGLSFLLVPMPAPDAWHIPFSAIRWIGLVFLAVVAGYFFWDKPRTVPIRFREWELYLPSRVLSLKQIFLSSIDWMLAAAVQYVLLPHALQPAMHISFPAFLSVFLLAQCGALASHVPGGIGVYESAMMLLLADRFNPPALVGALVVYRAIYYLMPLAIAVFFLAGHEIVVRRQTATRVAETVARGYGVLTPRVFSVALFVCGAVLMLSGALPPTGHRFAWIAHYVPLFILESSHFFGSLLGLGLIVLARGLQRRLESAWLLSCLGLAIGSMLCILKGGDFEEAILMLVMLLALLPCRPEFYRRSALIESRFTPGWIAAVLTVLVCAVWLASFSHKQLQFSGDLWWRITLHGDAPRALRATLGAAVLAALLASARLMRPAKPPPALPTAEDLDRAAALIAGSSNRSDACLALLGDKTLLFSDDSKAMLMFAVKHRSWVCMGDPIGDPAQAAEMTWRFRELSDNHDGFCVFYEVRPAYLQYYLDLGLSLMKLGEEARVELPNFSLDGSSRKNLRRISNSLHKQDCVFEIVPRTGVPAILPELRSISDAWMAEKNTREKGFSLGRFDPAYLSRFPAAVVRKDQRIIAFANLWGVPDALLDAQNTADPSQGREFSVDLMRYLPDAPPGVMDFLFIEAMMWGRSKGYGYFNLGMAPLSGLVDRSLAPMWNRVGAFVFRHARHVYNYQGLRRFKEKFDPVWEPRYLAAPGGFTLAAVLRDIASLISGGTAGIIKK